MDVAVAYREVVSTGFVSSYDHICTLHSSVWTQAEADPARGVDRQLEHNVIFHIIKAPLQTNQVILVQVHHEGHGVVRGRRSLGSQQEQAEEREQRAAHDVSVKLEIFKLNSLSVNLANSLPPWTHLHCEMNSGDTGEKVPSHFTLGLGGQRTSRQQHFLL